MLVRLGKKRRYVQQKKEEPTYLFTPEMNRSADTKQAQINKQVLDPLEKTLHCNKVEGGNSTVVSQSKSQTCKRKPEKANTFFPFSRWKHGKNLGSTDSTHTGMFEFQNCCQPTFTHLQIATNMICVVIFKPYKTLNNSGNEALDNLDCKNAAKK